MSVPESHRSNAPAALATIIGGFVALSLTAIYEPELAWLAAGGIILFAAASLVIALWKK